MKTIDRKTINAEKIRQLASVNESLDTQYGPVGTASRDAFSNKANAYFSG